MNATIVRSPEAIATKIAKIEGELTETQRVHDTFRQDDWRRQSYEMAMSELRTELNALRWVLGRDVADVRWRD